MPKVEIYVQDFCPYCARAVSLLQKKGVPFEEKYAPHGSANRAEAIERSGGRTTVPQVFIDGKHIGGSDDLMALDRKGGLDPLLAA
ncbi:glutaredoxin 3 [Falsiroseomonas sp.]|uniref:glutaredoxin 3 n=1 Tax=Falsiroseomonas sp. TaxID=2870721 RepID=UPI003562F6EC